MREIKFRGKRVDSGEWVYGYYLIAAGMTFISCFGERQPIHVDRKTVGQYTGKSDKNGREICEGDLLFDPDYDDDLIIVVWNNDELCYYAKYVNNSGSDPLNHYYTDGLEIIGNIHDNPELLEVEV